VFAFDEPVAAQEFVEEENDERAGSTDEKAHDTDRGYSLAFKEKRHEATSDDRTANAHR